MVTQASASGLKVSNFASETAVWFLSSNLKIKPFSKSVGFIFLYNFIYLLSIHPSITTYPALRLAEVLEPIKAI